MTELSRLERATLSVIAERGHLPIEALRVAVGERLGSGPLGALTMQIILEDLVAIQHLTPERQLTAVGVGAATPTVTGHNQS